MLGRRANGIIENAQTNAAENIGGTRGLAEQQVSKEMCAVESDVFGSTGIRKHDCRTETDGRARRPSSTSLIFVLIARSPQSFRLRHRRRSR